MYDVIVVGARCGGAPTAMLLDGLLVEAAVAAGAELWEGCSVEGLLTDGDAVTGIHGRSGGRAVTARARVVIGADGTRSRIAVWVRAPRYHSQPAVQGSYFSYWSGVPVERERFFGVFSGSVQPHEFFGGTYRSAA